MGKKNIKHLTVRLPAQWHEKLKAIAKKEHRSINGMYVYLIEEYIKSSSTKDNA